MAIKKDELIAMIKELIKERLEQSRGLLAAPPSNKIDEYLSERLEQIINKKKL